MSLTIIIREHLLKCIRDFWGLEVENDGTIIDNSSFYVLAQAGKEVAQGSSSGLYIFIYSNKVDYCINSADQYKSRRAIVIIGDSLCNKKDVAKISKIPTLELIYSDDSFAYIISESDYYTPSRILSAEEIGDLEKNEYIYSQNLPEILEGDTACVWIHARAGDIIEITESGPTTVVGYWRVIPGIPKLHQKLRQKSSSRDKNE